MPTLLTVLCAKYGLYIHLLCIDFVCMCGCSDTGNMQLAYNSPGGCLVHVLFSQRVYFPINGPWRTSGKPRYEPPYMVTPNCLWSAGLGCQIISVLTFRPALSAKLKRGYVKSYAVALSVEGASQSWLRPGPRVRQILPCVQKDINLNKFHAPGD